MLTKRQLLGGVAALAIVGSVNAQEPQDSTGFRGVGGIPTLGASRVGFASEGVVSPVFLPQQARDRKEPFLAGVLSLWLPGVGSFYAGHSRHGWTHAGVAVGSVVIIYAGASDCQKTLNGIDQKCVEEGLPLVAVGYLGLVVNTVWAIISGVDDARAYNAGGTGRVVGQLYFDPQVRALKTASPNGERSVGLQVLSLKY